MAMARLNNVDPDAYKPKDAGYKEHDADMFLYRLFKKDTESHRVSRLPGRQYLYDSNIMIQHCFFDFETMANYNGMMYPLGQENTSVHSYLVDEFDRTGFIGFMNETFDKETFDKHTFDKFLNNKHYKGSNPKRSLFISIPYRGRQLVNGGLNNISSVFRELPVDIKAEYDSRTRQLGGIYQDLTYIDTGPPTVRTAYAANEIPDMIEGYGMAKFGPIGRYNEPHPYVAGGHSYYGPLAYSRLGRLMPTQNMKEVDFRGHGRILGIMIDATTNDFMELFMNEFLTSAKFRESIGYNEASNILSIESIPEPNYDMLSSHESKQAENDKDDKMKRIRRRENDLREIPPAELNITKLKQAYINLCKLICSPENRRHIGTHIKLEPVRLYLENVWKARITEYVRNKIYSDAGRFPTGVEEHPVTNIQFLTYNQITKDLSTSTKLEVQQSLYKVCNGGKVMPQIKPKPGASQFKSGRGKFRSKGHSGGGILFRKKTFKKSVDKSKSKKNAKTTNRKSNSKKKRLSKKKKTTFRKTKR